jgi:hypothetical protein
MVYSERFWARSCVRVRERKILRFLGNFLQ